MILSLRHIGLAAIALAVSAAAFSHHSSDPHFDHDSPMTVEGVVTELRFVNPHGYVYFDVTSDDGEAVPWRCELSAATSLSRRGWTRDTIKAGQHIVVHGTPARREDNVCFLNSFELDRGREIGRGERFNEGATQVASAAADGSDRSSRLPDGQPNLTGPWVSLSFGLS